MGLMHTALAAPMGLEGDNSPAVAKLKAAAAKRAVDAVNAAGSDDDEDAEESDDEDDEGDGDEDDSAPENGDEPASGGGKGKGKGKAASLDEFPDQIAGGDATVAESEATKRALAEEGQFKGLFSGCWFYLNREVPRQSLEFVIRSFGVMHMQYAHVK